MGYLSYIESHNRHSLPHTPPDLVRSGCSPAASYTSSAPGDAAPPRGSPPKDIPKDLSWPHPQPPISPPMSSHDQPPPPPPSALRSPPRTVSPGTSGSMSMAATAVASLARASLATVSSMESGNVTRIASITDASPTTAARPASLSAEETTTTTTPATTAPAPQPEKLPSLSSIFGPSALDRPLLPTSAPAGPPPPPLSQLPPPGSYSNGPDERERPPVSSAYQRSSYGRPPSPALPTPQSAYLPAPQSTTGREQQRPPPPPPYAHHHYDQRSPRTDDRQPAAPPTAAGRHYPPSPRSYEQEQQQQQQSSHPWPESHPGYVAVSKWSLQDGPKAELRSSYSEQKPSYGAQQSPEYQRYAQPLPPSHPSQPNDHYRQQQHHHHQQPQPPLHGYHGHGPHSNPPPQHVQHAQHAQHASRSPVRGSAPVADGRTPSMSGSLPLTPASAAFPEGGVPPKEGMGLGVGPKIWTGQDFLPQFLRVAEVPGEGTCYFYDDGTHCKAVIDGEAVNPYWGVTKAGKPRKRLAIACMTCREKKIKCDPEYPRCVQCEKFGRLCRFKNAPRGGNNNSPGSGSSTAVAATATATATEPDAHRKIRSESALRPPQPQSPRDSKASMARPLSPRSGTKRPADYDHYTTTNSRARSPPFSNRSPTLSDVSRGSSSVLPPPHGWGSNSSSNQQASQRPPPPPSSYPRSSSQYSPHSPHSPYSQHAPHSQHSPHAQYASHASHAHAQPPSSAYDHHRHSYPDHQAYPHSQPRSQPRSQPPSPSQPDLPRMLLPPPRSAPDLPRVHDDVLRRSWQSDLRPHGRA